MLRVGLGTSNAMAPRDAVREAAETARKRGSLDRVDGALAVFTRGALGFASGPDAALDLGGELLAEAAACLGTPVVTGGAVESAFGANGYTPNVSILAFGGLEAHSVGMHAGIPDESFEEEMEAALGRSLDDRDLVLVLAEPNRVHLRRLLAGVEAEAGSRAPIAPALIGLGAADPLFAGGHVAVEVATLVLRTGTAPRIQIAQGCRPISAPLEITAAEGHWIYELDDRPALRSYREAARDPLAADLPRAAQRIVMGLPVSVGARPRTAKEVERAMREGHFAARSITGFDEERGALATSEVLRPGAHISWLLRDESVARDTLKTCLADPRAGAALYLCCPGRGTALFQHEGLEEGYVSNALQDIPWLGLRGMVQMAPLAGAPQLLQYAGVLALLDPPPSTSSDGALARKVEKA